MKTKVLVWALVVLVLVNVATLGTFLYLRFARTDDGFPRFRGGPPPEMAQLDPGTRERIRAIVVEFRRETEPLHLQIRAVEDSIAVLLHRDPLPRERIDGLLRRIADTRAEIGRRAVDHLVGAKSILTPEQYRFFVGAVLSGQPRGMEGHGPAGGRRFGPPPGIPPAPGEAPPDGPGPPP